MHRGKKIQREAGMDGRTFKVNQGERALEERQEERL
jgi:hypothetical protein